MRGIIVSQMAFAITMGTHACVVCSAHKAYEILFAMLLSLHSASSSNNITDIYSCDLLLHMHRLILYNRTEYTKMNRALSTISGSASGNMGLAVTQIFSLMTMCQWGMRQTSEVENQMTSVERVVEYSQLKSEAALETEESQRPADDRWPNDGAITFDKLSLRYSQHGHPVLKNVSLQIRAGEKVGIVGRTGAGKSSIIQALFRLAHNDGHIVIDDVDIGKLGLHELRQKISIIPQDPILFSGTMRDNLDPFNQKTDDELWRALALVSDQIRSI